MLRVYLDQNKWIDLARAAIGHRHGAQFVGALTSARAAVASGTASFPLDIYRYLETARRADHRSRLDVADLMFELSKQDAIARPHALLPTEIDLALNRRFGRPEEPRQHPVFGTGMRHITAGGVTLPSLDPSRLPDCGKSLSPAERITVERLFNDLAERELLRMGPATSRAAGFDPSSTELAQRYVDHENSIAAAIRDQGLSGALLDLAVRASDLGDIRPAVTEALERIGMTWDGFIESMGPTEIWQFMDDLPTRYVTNVMRSAKLRQSEQKWELNDLNDIVALPVAAVYCDVVFTEKQWVHRLRQGKVGQRYNTTLLSDTAALVDVLSADRASRAAISGGAHG